MSSDLYLAGTFATTTTGLQFTRSTDGGRTFETPRGVDPTNGSQGRLPVAAAGPDGLVAVMYYVGQPDGTNLATVVTSTDHGETFGPPAVLGVVRHPSQTVERGGPALTADPATGDLYAAVVTGGPAGPSELDAYTSHDHGRTWSAATMVARSDTVTYSQPQLSVDDAGRVGLSTFAITSGRADQLLFISPPRTVNFEAPRSVTPTGFDTALGLATGSADADGDNASSDHWIGDYQGLTASPTGFHPVWNDTRTGRLELFTATIPSD